MTPEEADALRAFLATAAEHGIPVLLVGARARQLAFDAPRALRPRATRDWDFAADVPSWAAYWALLDALETAGFVVRRDQGTARHADGARLDILPVGGVVGDDGRVVWPGDAGGSLRMTGYREAWASATAGTIGGIAVHVVSVPGLALLKLIAWSDRREPKHLIDVAHLLLHYDTSRGERLFDEDPGPDWSRVDARALDAWLLGVDLRRAFDSKLVGLLVSIVDEVLLPDTPALAVATRAEERIPTDEAVEEVRRRFEAFRDGLTGEG